MLGVGVGVGVGEPEGVGDPDAVAVGEAEVVAVGEPEALAGSGAGVVGDGVMDMARGPLDGTSPGMGVDPWGSPGVPMRSMGMYRASRRRTNWQFSSRDWNSSR